MRANKTRCFLRSRVFSSHLNISRASLAKTSVQLCRQRSVPPLRAYPSSVVLRTILRLHFQCRRPAHRTKKEICLLYFAVLLGRAINSTPLILHRRHQYNARWTSAWSLNGAGFPARRSLWNSPMKSFANANEDLITHGTSTNTHYWLFCIGGMMIQTDLSSHESSTPSPTRILITTNYVTDITRISFSLVVRRCRSLMKS